MTVVQRNWHCCFELQTLSNTYNNSKFVFVRLDGSARRLLGSRGKGSSRGNEGGGNSELHGVSFVQIFGFQKSERRKIVRADPRGELLQPARAKDMLQGWTDIGLGVTEFILGV